MSKNIVICLDGTNNKLRAAVNTNVVRLFSMLDLSDPSIQVGYYDPGVGTFSAAGAWTPVARTISRYAGLMFGAGLRQNLGEAYSYLISVYEPGDRIFLFGFSRGAYTARALAGMLDVFGIFRRGSENLVPYAVSEYARQERRGSPDRFTGLRVYAATHAVVGPDGHRDHAPVRFVGLWDTVKAAGHIGRTLRWPYTRQLPHAQAVRHAVSIDENRRPFAAYLLRPTDPDHLLACADQDAQEVWFAGVHSDVGGMFASGALLSDIPLKWVADAAVRCGLRVRPRLFNAASALKGVDPTGAVHRMNPLWRLLGPGHRHVPPGAAVHASVADRLAVDPSYATNLPTTYTVVDPHWRTPLRTAKQPRDTSPQPR